MIRPENHITLALRVRASRSDLNGVSLLVRYSQGARRIESNALYIILINATAFDNIAYGGSDLCPYVICGLLKYVRIAL